MSLYTRSGRMALESHCEYPGHWHIEGWCVTSDAGGRKVRWQAVNGPCQDLGITTPGQRTIYATTLNAMRDCIRDEIAGTQA